jgi:hypothetical protein
MKARLLPDPEYFKEEPVIRDDYEDIELTFVTSSKGGLGKTTFTEAIIISKLIRDKKECAICHGRFKKITEKHLQTHGIGFETYNKYLKMLGEVYNPVVIDANENNQDLVVIFDAFQNASRTIETDDFVMRELKQSESSDSTFILVYPKKHLHLGSEMFKFVQLVIDSIPSRRSFIVDSAFHIERFVINGDSHSMPTAGSGIPHLNGSVNPRFLFLWRWSAPANYVEIHKIQRAINWFRLAIPNWSDDNFISVFNLYDLYHQTTNRNLNRIVSTWDRNMKRNHVVSPVGFNDLIDLIEKLRADMRGYKIGKTIEIKKIPSLWIRFFHQLLRVLKVKNADRSVIPSNIIIIPTFYRGLVMTIDGLTLDRPSNIYELEENMRPFVKRLRMFFKIRTKTENARIEKECEIFENLWKEIRETKLAKDVIVLSPKDVAKNLSNIVISEKLVDNVEIVTSFDKLMSAIKLNKYKHVFVRVKKGEEAAIEMMTSFLKYFGEMEMTKLTYIEENEPEDPFYDILDAIKTPKASWILDSIKNKLGLKKKVIEEEDKEEIISVEYEEGSEDDMEITDDDVLDLDNIDDVNED